MPYCGSQTIAIASEGKARAFPLRCRSWGCPNCAPMRRRKLIADGIAGKPNRFITLTVNPNWYDSPAERGLALSRAWRDYVREFRRLHPRRELQYLAVLELTKRGEPHLHIVTRSGWIGQRELSAHMLKTMGAPIVDIRQVRGHQAVAQYVSKYISKRNIKLGTLKRYWSSQNYVLAAERERRAAAKVYRAVWVIDVKIAEYRDLMTKMGFVIGMKGLDGIEWKMHDWEAKPPAYSQYARRVR